MKVFAIIVTYNGEKWINNCLSSLRSSTLSIVPIVIDNASTDSTREILQEYKDITFIPAKENLGFGRANNIGIRYALDQQADYILLLNQDAYLEKNVIEGLIRLSEKHPDFGILSPVHLNGDGRELDEGFANYTGLTSIPDKEQKMTLKKVDFINAAIWLVPAKVFLEVGGFDPLFLHYGEDYDFIQRVHYHGYQVGYCPVLRVYHDRESRKKESPQQRLSRDFIYFLNVAKNIHLSERKIAWKIYKEVFHNGIKNRQLLDYLKIIKILRKNKEVIKQSRKLVIKKGNHFLDNKEICSKPLSYS